MRRGVPARKLTGRHISRRRPEEQRRRSLPPGNSCRLQSLDQPALRQKMGAQSTDADDVLCVLSVSDFGREAHTLEVCRPDSEDQVDTSKLGLGAEVGDTNREHRELWVSIFWRQGRPIKLRAGRGRPPEPMSFRDPLEMPPPGHTHCTRDWQHMVASRSEPALLVDRAMRFDEVP